MVMPRSRSRSMLSRNWSCASRADTVPVISSSRSDSVLFPWSMCAMMEKLRRCWFSAAMDEPRGLACRSRWHNARSEGQQVDAEESQPPVGAEHRKPVEDGLRDQKPIERVSMVHRQLRDVQDMSELDVERPGHARFQAGNHVPLGRIRKSQLPDRELDGELPDTRQREEPFRRWLVEKLQGPAREPGHALVL